MARLRASTWLEDVQKEPITWAIPDYFPRRVVSSIYGPRNSGKTLAAVWLAVKASTELELRVWMNSQEDHLATVLRPRLDAAGALDRRIRLTDNRWRLPNDLGSISDELRLHAAGGLPMTCSSWTVSSSTLPVYAFAPAQATIKGLHEIAQEFDMAVTLIGHTTKGKHASVEAMIAGSTVLQNMSKAIYVFGP